MKHGKTIADITLAVPGAHNVSNSLAAAAAAIELGISSRAVAEGLFDFKGTDRRFEFKGLYKDGITVIDDYVIFPRPNGGSSGLAPPEAGG